MGISPFPGQDLGLFTFMHSLSIKGDAYGFFHDQQGRLAVIPLDKDDVSYFVSGQTYDLGVVIPK